MEGGENKQPKSSNDETDSSGQARESSAASRFYECMFCRRGFTTAQALGGHMNIHRRDRARMRLNEAFSVSTKNDGEGSGSGASYDLNEDYRRLYPPVLSDPLKNYPVYFASSSSSSQEASLSADRSLQIRPSELTLFGGDQSHMLSQMHESTVKHREEEKKEDEDTEELDLELRLGHDP